MLNPILLLLPGPVTVFELLKMFLGKLGTLTTSKIQIISAIYLASGLNLHIYTTLYIWPLKNTLDYMLRRIGLFGVLNTGKIFFHSNIGIFQNIHLKLK